MSYTSEHRVSEDELDHLDTIPTWVSTHSVTCPLCGDYADERETIDLWNEPRFPNGEAHQSCYDEWQDKPTYVVISLGSFESLHPDNEDAGRKLVASVYDSYTDKEAAHTVADGSDRVVVEVTSNDIKPAYE